MLVLSRKLDEEILIGNDIRIMVISTRGDIVRIGVESPRHVAVHRKEIYERIQRERESAVPKVSVSP